MAEIDGKTFNLTQYKFCLPLGATVLQYYCRVISIWRKRGRNHILLMSRSVTLNGNAELMITYPEPVN
jgi:hypothetical protein